MAAAAAASATSVALLEDILEAVRLFHLYTPAWRKLLDDYTSGGSGESGIVTTGSPLLLGGATTAAGSGAAAVSSADLSPSEVVDASWLVLRAWPSLLDLWDVAAARDACMEWSAFLNRKTTTSIAARRRASGSEAVSKSLTAAGPSASTAPMTTRDLRNGVDDDVNGDSIIPMGWVLTEATEALERMAPDVGFELSLEAAKLLQVCFFFL